MDKRKNQRRNSQKTLLAKRRDNSFIAEYVRRKAPGLYSEAEGFLNHLRTLHPEKRDYTKTHEFLVSTTGFTDYKEYYNRKRLNRFKQKESSRNTTTTTTMTTTTTVDNMELNVVLMPEPVVKENTMVPFQPLTEETYQDLIKEITSDPSLQPIFNQIVNNQDPEIGLDSEIGLDPEVDEIINGLTPLEKELIDRV